MDYYDLMDNIEELLCKLVIDIFGIIIVFYGEYIFDFGKLFECIIMYDVIVKYGNGIKCEDLDNFEKLVEIVKGLGIEI